MKELSIEEKAKRYDESIARARKLKETCDSRAVVGWCEYILPELKESEDEKIRKALINVFATHKDYEVFFGVSVEDIHAWLEKQGESKFEQCIQEGDKIVSNEDGTHFNVSQLERVSQKVTDTKETAKKFLKTAGIMDKNGEQLAEEYMQEKSSKFHIGDTVKIHCCERPKHIQDVYNNKVGNIDCIWDLNENPWGNIGVRLENGCNNLFFESELEIVEPKFKIGDWVVCEITDSVYQIKDCIENLSNHKYGYLTNGDYISSVEVNHYHLWTIQDAKDGDVLVTVDGKRPFIYKGCLDPHHPDSPVAYCGIDTEGYFCRGGDNFDHWWTDVKVQPATKEQHDFLFQKMKEDGYEWNADKKELKKIDSYCQKNCRGYQETGRCFADGECQAKKDAESTWCEKDEEMLEDIRFNYEFNKSGMTEGLIEQYNKWFEKIKSLKPQPKQEWSAEDKRNLLDVKCIIDEVWHSKDFSICYSTEELESLWHWLDNIWQKVDYPQNTWKPSEEQIQALEYQVNSTYKGSWQYKASKELLEQIKKL